MIVVKIELHSAVNGSVSEIGRMVIANDGDSDTVVRGNYDVAVCRRGSTAVPAPIDPDGPKATRTGRVEDYPRIAYNVWRLIARAVLAAFPEERTSKHTGKPVLDEQVMRGLELMRLHLDDDGHEWGFEQTTAVQAARAWLSQGER